MEIITRGSSFREGHFGLYGRRFVKPLNLLSHLWFR